MRAVRAHTHDVLHEHLTVGIRLRAVAAHLQASVTAGPFTLLTSAVNSPSSSRHRYSACNLRLVWRGLPPGDHFHTRSAIATRLSPGKASGAVSSAPDRR